MGEDPKVPVLRLLRKKLRYGTYLRYLRYSKCVPRVFCALLYCHSSRLVTHVEGGHSIKRKQDCSSWATLQGRNAACTQRVKWHSSHPIDSHVSLHGTGAVACTLPRGGGRG